jgi:hypothetical protein
MGIIFGFEFIQIAQSVPSLLALSPPLQAPDFGYSLLHARCSLQNSNYLIVIKSIRVVKASTQQETGVI